MEPGYIGKIRTRNRILKMGATPGFLPYEDGYVQQKIIDLYEAIAKGGAGMVTINASPIGGLPGRGFEMDDDKYIPRLTELANAIRKHDCPAFSQMFHIGPWLPNPYTVSASSLPREEIPFVGFAIDRELTIADIKAIIKKFGDVAERLKKCGFQGIELNAGCSHLLSTFLSRFWNRRQDEYGAGSMENRARIVTEIIQEIKKRNGADYPVVVLFNAAEPGLKNGITAAEGQELARLFEKGGADAINVRVEFYVHRDSTGRNDSTHFPDMAMYPEAPAYAKGVVDTEHHGAYGWVPLAAGIKKVVKIPVIVSGRMDMESGEKLIKQGSIDFVNFNRRLLADHDLPNKISEGRLEDIAPCTGCMTCFNENELGNPVKCRINAALMKEKEYEIKPAAKKKKVLVVGGGPAGMEAARVAALRGHQVTLMEREPMLGGAMNLAAVVKGTEREDLLALIDYLKTQITKNGVDIRLGKEVDKAAVQELKPDVVIIAAGGDHDIPNIPGIDNKKVLTSKALHHQLKTYLKLTGARLMTKLVTKYLPVGKNVVVVGGNIQGCQTAEFLTRRGRKVTILETGPEIGEGLLVNLVKPQLIEWLYQKKVAMLPGVKIDKITSEGVAFTDKEGKQQTTAADTVLTALPLKPNTALFDSLKGAVPEVYNIGDSKQPGLIVDAVADGSCIARQI